MRPISQEQFYSNIHHEKRKIDVFTKLQANNSAIETTIIVKTTLIDNDGNKRPWIKPIGRMIVELYEDGTSLTFCTWET